MTSLEIDFVRRCAKRTNDLNRAACAEFNRALLSFIVLGFLLVLLAFAGIALKWSPGSHTAQQTEVSK